MKVRCFAVLFAGLFLLLLIQPTANADSFSCTPGTNSESCTVSINTSSLSGAGFGFFPALLDASQTGDGNNTVSLSGFNFGGGSAGSASSFGGGSGNFTSGMTIKDSDPSGFNSVLGLFTPGGTISFNLLMSTFADSGNLHGMTGDEFVLMMLEPGVGITNVPTTDTTPLEDAFFTLTVCPSCPNGVSIQQFSIPSSSSVPEPATLLLLGSGMIGLGLGKRRLSKRASSSR